MIFKTTEQKRHGFRAALVGGASVLAMGTVSANAQDDVDQVQDDNSVVRPVELVEDTIVVTGSRIRRSELNSGNPIFTLGEQAVQDRAFTNVADLLNESPLFNGSVTPDGDVGAFTAGQNQPNLFDLGADRTLTLLNGRRLVSSNSAAVGGLQVDTNVIPVGLLERTEIVPLTGAATYGADAIAGTVNLILKTDFEGFDSYAQYGVSDEGDAKSYQIGFLGGANMLDGRGNVVFGVEYTQDEGLLRTDRPRYTRDDPNFVNFGNRAIDVDGDGIADGVIEEGDFAGFSDLDGDGEPDPISLVFRDQRVQLFTTGGAVSPTPTFLPSRGAGRIGDEFYQFDDNGNLQTCEAGVTPAGSAFFAQGGTCGLDFFDQVDQLRSPVERINAYGAVNFEIAENVSVRSDLLFANTRGEELVEQGGFQTFAFDGASAALTFDTDNPFLTDQARGILEGAGLDSFALNRFNNDIVASGGSSNEVSLYRFSSVLSGEFEKADRNFYYDIGVVYGESDIVAASAAGGIIDGRFINALDARRVNDDLLDGIIAGAGDDDSDIDLDFDMDGTVTRDEAFTALEGVLPNVARGDIICGAFADLAAGTLEGFNEQASGNGVTDADRPFLDGCTPLNLFGEGNASPEAIAYVTGGPRFSKSENRQTVFTANFGGELFELPAGPLSFNVGAESRREESGIQPGLGSSINITRSVPQAPISGRFTTAEYYGEVLIPIVSPDMDIPFIQNLELNGAYRDQTVDLTGPAGERSELTAEVFTISGRWQPIDDIQFRATYAEAFRIPNFTDLFLPQTQAFISGADPCDQRFVGRGPNPDARRANCAAEGIDTTSFDSTISNRTISAGLVSGNPNLGPETNESWSVGAVIEPRFVDGLALAIDYYNLDLVDGIQFLDFEELAATCYDSNDFPNEAACDTFERGDDGQVTFASETFANVAGLTLESVTGRLFYNFDVNDALGLIGMDSDDDLGGLSLDLFGIHRITNESQATLASEIDEDVGDFADPDFSGYVDVAYGRGPLRATWRMNWQSAVEIDALEQQQYALDYVILDDGTISADIQNRTNARFIHNFGVRYDVNDALAFQVNVLNAFEREPNNLEEAAGHFTNTEIIGRQLRFRLSTSF